MATANVFSSAGVIGALVTVLIAIAIGAIVAAIILIAKHRAPAPPAPPVTPPSPADKAKARVLRRRISTLTTRIASLQGLLLRLKERLDDAKESLANAAEARDKAITKQGDAEDDWTDAIKAETAAQEKLDQANARHEPATVTGPLANALATAQAEVVRTHGVYQTAVGNVVAAQLVVDNAKAEVADLKNKVRAKEGEIRAAETELARKKTALSKLPATA